MREPAGPGPLAGVPFAVKNLIDVAGLPTLAGSKINRDHPPATADAPLIARLEAAGAILVGALNMGEYAYDFTGENAHDGPSRNPHDTDADGRRVLGRFRRRGRRRPGAAGAGLRHQRVDPGAVLVLRLVRAEADLWAADPRRQLSVRVQSGPSRPVGAHRRGSGGVPTMRCRATIRPIRSALIARPNRSPAELDAGHRRAAYRLRRRLFPGRRVAGGLAALDAIAPPWAPKQTIEHPRGRSARAVRRTSSPRPRALPCTCDGCARGRMISTPMCATG